MLVDDVNASGGILGRKIELIIKDSQGNAEKAVSFAKQLVEERPVLAIIGPTTSGESMALKGYADQNEQILISCAAAATIVNPVAKWVFKTPQMDSFAAQAIFTTMKKLGISRIGVVVSNTGFGQGGKAQLEKLAPQNGITVAITEVYDSTATDLTARAGQGESAERPGGGELVGRAGAVPRPEEHEADGLRRAALPEPRVRQHRFRDRGGQGRRRDRLPRGTAARGGRPSRRPPAEAAPRRVQEGLRGEVPGRRRAPSAATPTTRS